jgi:hypothetical protein
LLVAACVYWAVPLVLEKLQTLALPSDGIYGAVGYLMWSGSAGASTRMQTAFEAGVTLHLVAAAVLASSALLPREGMFTPVHVIARRFYRYAIALPVWTIVTANLARFVGDEVYVLAKIVNWDITPYVARVEAPVLAALQRWLESPGLSRAASIYYSAGWVGVLAFAGFAFVAADKSKILNSLLVAYALTAACAAPLFVLIPLTDPWTTNALYGGAENAARGVRYLYSYASAPTLARINAQFHLAAIGTVPSLHVAFPLVVSLVLRRHGQRIASIAMAIMAAISAFVVIYLGRNWLIGVVAAVPFAFAVFALIRRVRLNLTITPRRKAVSVLRPGEVAVPVNPAIDELQWSSAVLFVSGFAALLYALSWQRALVANVGLDVVTFELVTSAFVGGLIVGVVTGGAVAKRSAVSGTLWLAALQAGIAIFGAFSPIVIRVAGGALVSSSSATGSIVIFAVLIPPAVLIGATLPLLATTQLRVRRSVVEALGRAQFSALLGAGAGAILAALALLGPLGGIATVQIAAVLNFGAGVLAYTHSRNRLVIR